MRKTNRVRETPRMYRAKLFRTGGSQALRLPKACRLPGDEAIIRRDGDRLVVEPVHRDWSSAFLALMHGPKTDFPLPEEPPEAYAEDVEPL